ncbi:hypothetical protein DSO57_1026840 [Entomophthora muscae]|uniref:Uncharacterized protein n=1 Tax=Entomophthora muscae TaxID=34485 RepID=A0ACC2S3V6_9FUNG|nr:hypothetical protein DSO57_1026840 [Entomophthora muscae]
MSGGFKATEMKYWNRVKVSLKQAGEWTKVGITPEIHTTMGDNPIIIDQWRDWKSTTHITEAAEWIKLGFSLEQAQLWKEYRILPSQAVTLKGVVTPMEAKEWIQVGFEASQIGTWRQAIPNARNASTYMKMNIACVDAAQWFDVGFAAEEANYFEQGGWKYPKTVKWMHANEVDFDKFRQFIHYSSNPDKILEWSRTKFPPHRHANGWQWK